MAYLQCTFVTGSSCTLSVKASGSVAVPTVFSVDGGLGRLLEVNDSFCPSVFSANTIAGLPVIEAFSNYCVSMGQYGGHKFEVTCTSIRGGKCTTASGTYSFVGGGCCNVASGINSFVGGGGGNTASGYYSFVGGGGGNTASGYYSFVGNGLSNVASGYRSIIGGGEYNTACGTRSGTFSGRYNNSNGDHSFVGGGGGNTASGYYSFVGGGGSNLASGKNAFIGGGLNNFIDASSPYNSIVGGLSNSIIDYASNSFIGGGSSNTISSYSYFSTIIGGCGNASNGYSNVHILGSGLTASAYNTTFVENLCASQCVWAAAYYCVSDERLKNVKSTCHSFDNINPVQYSWKEGDPSIFHYGYLAQNVQCTLPNAVKCNNAGTMSVDYSQVHTYKIMKLEERINQLTKELNEIKSLLNQ